MGTRSSCCDGRLLLLHCCLHRLWIAHLGAALVSCIRPRQNVRVGPVRWEKKVSPACIRRDPAKLEPVSPIIFQRDRVLCSLGDRIICFLEELDKERVREQLTCWLVPPSLAFASALESFLALGIGPVLLWSPACENL